MEKVDTETFDIDYMGTTWDVTCVHWSFSSNDEIDVSVHNPNADPQNRKHKFRVADKKEREAVFRENNIEDNRPSAQSLIGLYRFGWECTNFSKERVEMEEAELIGPTLQYVDDLLYQLLTHETGLENHPFMADMIEMALSAVAMVNTTCHEHYDGKGRLNDEDAFFVWDEPETARMHTLTSCAIDPYHFPVLQECMKAHHDIHITMEDVEEFRGAEEFRELRKTGMFPEYREEYDVRPESFDGTEYYEWFRKQSGWER